MANKNWIKGCKSPNPKGASIRVKRKNSNEELRDVLARVLKRNFSAKKLTAMIAGLKSDKDRLEFYLAAMPYLVGKKAAIELKGQLESLPNDQLDALYERIIRGEPGQIQDAQETNERGPLLLPEIIKQSGNEVEE